MDIQNRLGYIEYENALYDNLSKVVINQNYIKENQEFWDKVVYKMYEQYYFGIEEISIRKQAALLEIVLSALMTYKPSYDLPEDYLNL